MSGTEIQPKVHATLGASSAKRWRNCPGSVRLIAAIGERDSSSDASRAGTAAHALMELCLTKNVSPDIYEGMTLEGVVVDEEMIGYTTPMVDYCRSLPGVGHVEVRFDLSAISGGIPLYGTCDYMAYDEANKRVEIVDFKSGSGVMVDAIGNDQLAYYALGAVLKLGHPVEEIILTIVQPRGFHDAGPIRSDSMTYVELMEFGAALIADAKATLAPDAPLHAGSWCRWCAAAGACPEQHRVAVELAQIRFNPIASMPEPTPPALLSVEERLRVMEIFPMIKTWMRDVERSIGEMLEQGLDIPGWKLVERRAVRRWANERDTEAWLLAQGLGGMDIHEPSVLKSPAQIEKVLGKGGKKLIEDRVTKQSSGLAMVPITDPRPEVASLASHSFPVLNAGDDE